MSARRPSFLRVARGVAGGVRAGSCFALAGILVFALTGCKAMTTAQRQKEIEDAVKAELAERAREEAEQKKRELEAKDREVAAKEERLRKKSEAQLALANGQPGKAIELIQEVLEAKPTEGNEEQEGKEEVADAEPEEEAQETIPPPEIPDEEKAELLAIKALAHNDLNQVDEAITAYREVIELDSSLRIPRKNLGRLLFQQRKFQEALDVWRLELQDGYWDVEILELIGLANFELYRKERETSRLEAARFALQAALVKDPTSIKSRRLLAFLEYESKRYGEAIRLLKAITDDYPTDRDYLELLADAYIRAEDFENALDTLELAARLSPGNPRKRLCESLGDLYAKKGMHGQAADWFVRAYRGDPDQTPAADRLLIGRLLFEAGRLEEAIRWLGTLTESEDGYFEAQSVLATVYRDLGEENRALQAFENMRVVRPMDGLAHLSAGDMYLDQKRLDDAFEAYSKAAGLEGTKAEGLAGLAEVAYERKNLELAADYYRKALKERPEERRFRVALREIEEELKLREETRRLSGDVESGEAEPLTEAGNRGPIGGG